MLRGFVVIFVLCGIAIIAVFGFRGRKSTAPPTEVFPDMVRQMKVRAQAPLDWLATCNLSAVQGAADIAPQSQSQPNRRP